VTGISPLIMSFLLSTIVSEGSGTVGLKKDSPRSRGNVRGRSYIPESGLVCWALLD
jgi:hypothetical protein